MARSEDNVQVTLLLGTLPPDVPMLATSLPAAALDAVPTPYTFYVGGGLHCRSGPTWQDSGPYYWITVRTDVATATLDMLVKVFAQHVEQMAPDFWETPLPPHDVHALPWRAAVLYPAAADERPLCEPATFASSVSSAAALADLGNSPWNIDGQRFEPHWGVEPGDHGRSVCSFDAAAPEGGPLAARVWVYLDYDELMWSELAHFIALDDVVAALALEDEDDDDADAIAGGAGGGGGAVPVPVTHPPLNAAVCVASHRAFAMHSWAAAGHLANCDLMDRAGLVSPLLRFVGFQQAKVQVQQSCDRDTLSSMRVLLQDTHDAMSPVLNRVDEAYAVLGNSAHATGSDLWTAALAAATSDPGSPGYAHAAVISRSLAYHALKRRNDVALLLSSMSHGIADSADAVAPFPDGAAAVQRAEDAHAILRAVHDAACDRFRRTASSGCVMQRAGDAMLYHKRVAALQTPPLRPEDPLVYTGKFAQYYVSDEHKYSPEVYMLRHLAEMCAVAETVDNGVETMQIYLEASMCTLERRLHESPPVREMSSVADVCEEVEAHLRAFGCTMPDFAPRSLVRPLEKLSAVVHIVFQDELHRAIAAEAERRAEVFDAHGLPRSIESSTLAQALVNTPAAALYVPMIGTTPAMLRERYTATGGASADEEEQRVKTAVTQAWNLEHGAMLVGLERQFDLACRHGVTRGESMASLRSASLFLLHKMDDAIFNRSVWHRDLRQTTVYLGADPILGDVDKALGCDSNVSNAMLAIVLRRCCGAFRLAYRSGSPRGAANFTHSLAAHTPSEFRASLKAVQAELRSRFLPSTKPTIEQVLQRDGAAGVLPAVSVGLVTPDKSPHAFCLPTQCFESDYTHYGYTDIPVHAVTLWSNGDVEITHEVLTQTTSAAMHAGYALQLDGRLQAQAGAHVDNDAVLCASSVFPYPECATHVDAARRMTRLLTNDRLAADAMLARPACWDVAERPGGAAEIARLRDAVLHRDLTGYRDAAEATRLRDEVIAAVMLDDPAKLLNVLLALRNALQERPDTRRDVCDTVCTVPCVRIAAPHASVTTLPEQRPYTQYMQKGTILSVKIPLVRPNKSRAKTHQLYPAAHLPLRYRDHLHMPTVLPLEMAIRAGRPKCTTELLALFKMRNPAEDVGLAHAGADSVSMGTGLPELADAARIVHVLLSSSLAETLHRFHELSIEPAAMRTLDPTTAGRLEHLKLLLEDEVRHMRTLQDGWTYHRGIEPGTGVVMWANTLGTLLNRLTPTRKDPTQPSVCADPAHTRLVAGLSFGVLRTYMRRDRNTVATLLVDPIHGLYGGLMGNPGFKKLKEGALLGVELLAVDTDMAAARAHNDGTTVDEAAAQAQRAGKAKRLACDPETRRVAWTMQLHALTARAAAMYPWHHRGPNVRAFATELHFRALLRHLTYSDSVQNAAELRAAIVQLLYATIRSTNLTDATYPGAGRYEYMPLGVLLGCDYPQLVELGDEVYTEPVYTNGRAPAAGNKQRRIEMGVGDVRPAGAYVVRASRLFARLDRMTAGFRSECDLPFVRRSPRWAGTHWLKRGVAFTGDVRPFRDPNGKVVRDPKTEARLRANAAQGKVAVHHPGLLQYDFHTMTAILRDATAPRSNRVYSFSEYDAIRYPEILSPFEFAVEKSRYGAMRSSDDVPVLARAVYTELCALARKSLSLLHTHLLLFEMPEDDVPMRLRVETWELLGESGLDAFDGVAMLAADPDFADEPWGGTAEEQYLEYVARAVRLLRREMVATAAAMREAGEAQATAFGAGEEADAAAAEQARVQHEEARAQERPKEQAKRERHARNKGQAKDFAAYYRDTLLPELCAVTTANRRIREAKEVSERYDLQGGRLAYGDVAKEVLRERHERLGKLASQVADAWPHARRELDTLRDEVSVALGKGSVTAQKEQQKAKKAKKAAQKSGKTKAAPAPAPAPAPASVLAPAPASTSAPAPESDDDDDDDPELQEALLRSQQMAREEEQARQQHAAWGASPASPTSPTTSDVSAPSSASAAAAVAAADDAAALRARVEALELELANAIRGQECVFCMERVRTTMCRPCNHNVACDMCAPDIGPACPLCRKPIDKVERIFQ